MAIYIKNTYYFIPYHFIYIKANFLNKELIQSTIENHPSSGGLETNKITYKILQTLSYKLGVECSCENK